MVVLSLPCQEYYLLLVLFCVYSATLTNTPLCVLTKATPPLPVQCEAGSRTVEDARDIQLMEAVARQSNGPHPLLQLEGYVFRKIVVDQMTDANGTRHEVMFVTAYKDGKSCYYAFYFIDHLP